MAIFGPIGAAPIGTVPTATVVNRPERSELTPLISVMTQFAVNFPAVIQRFVSIAGF